MKPMLLLLLPLLGACAAQPPPDALASDDSLRAAAMEAPSVLGNTSRYAGDPAGAARAAAHMEVLAVGFRYDPVAAPNVAVNWQQLVEMGKVDMRRAVGIAPGAQGSAVIVQLRRAAAALEAGNRAEAEAALSGPMFPGGAAATLARLNALPYLPRVAEGAGGAVVGMRMIDLKA